MLRTVLVLGAKGFAGTHFSRLAGGSEMGVVRASRGRGGDAFADLRDRKSLSALLEAVKPDAVVNLAGSASVSESWRDPAGAEQVNVDGVENLIDAVQRHAPTCFLLIVSSGEVYGDLSGAGSPATEETTLNPMNPYAESKRRMEELFNDRVNAGGLRGAIVRAFNHIGPGQSERFAISSFARQIAQAERSDVDETVISVGNLSPKRDFSDVRDVVGAYLLVVERQLEGVYNVCSGVPRMIGEIAELLAGQSKLEVRFEVDEERFRPDDAPLSYGSARKLELATGWSPQLPLEQSLGDLIDWWRVRLG